VKNISISEKLTDKEEIEDCLIIALNMALKKAAAISEAELASAAKDGMPNIPGLDMFK
ncbi:MAG: YbaB/EbfC family nucleoid-associated protein, partial [Bacteroidetes bacterium]|nr:YbaB/EbfC family nucleoid-associated protein [Bacteroidota bacterium]